MLVIRLQRTGRRNAPTYRVVVAEKRMAVQGRTLEVIGYYLPTRDPVVLECDTERVTHWVSKGAVPSNTMARLLTKKGVEGLEKFIDSYTKQKSRKTSEEDAAPAPSPATDTSKSSDKPETSSEEPKEEEKEDEPSAEEVKEKEELTAPENGPEEAKAEEKADEGDTEDKAA